MVKNKQKLEVKVNFLINVLDVILFNIPIIYELIIIYLFFRDRNYFAILIISTVFFIVMSLLQFRSSAMRKVISILNMLSDVCGILILLLFMLVAFIFSTDNPSTTVYNGQLALSLLTALLIFTGIVLHIIYMIKKLKY